MNDSHNTILSSGEEVATPPSRLHRFGLTLLAVLLYLVLVDAAVETFVSGSPLRWWIAGAVLVYLALCATTWRLMPKVWRRVDWVTQATLSVMVLLAVMGATAWMSGGLEGGIRLFGQPTSIVLATVSAIAVAISGVFLARLHFVPLAGKIVAGLLAVYGVAGFLLAVNSGTSYPALFHGSSQWTRLPFWLQGATVGGLFVVPLALLLEIVTVLPRITRTKLSEFGFKVTALGMSLVMIVAAARMPADYDSGAIETPKWLSESHEKPLQGEAGYKQVSEKLNRLTAALEVVNGKIDRSLFEIDALAAHLGSDPAVMFHFVRDQIRYEPYTGILRGALGTLICRAGNSLDRSLLLAALLQKAGLKTQIATGQLDAQAAQVLVGRLFEPAKPAPNATPSVVDLAPEVSHALGIEPQQLLRTVDEMTKFGASRDKELTDYVRSETSSLSSLFSKAGADPGAVTPTDRLVAEAGEHYWVQYQNSDGQWVDLDSAFPGAEPGKVNAQITNTFAPDSMPEELYHHLRITLTLRVAEVVNGNDGPVTDTSLIDQELRAADQQGKDVILANSPLPVPDLTNPAMDPATLLTATKGYQTILQIGSQATSGKYFDLDGQVSDNPEGLGGVAASNAGAIGKSMGGQVGDLSGELGGGSSRPNTTRIVGEWVSYRLSSPGVHGEQPSMHDYRRDIIPPASVQSWSVSSPDHPQTIPTRLGKDALRERLMWFVELLPVTGDATFDYLGYLQIKSLLDNRAAIDSWMRIAYRLPLSQPPSGPVFSPPLVNLALSATAARSAAGLMNLQFPSIRSYFARPGLIAHEIGCFKADGGCTSDESFDIVAYPPRAVVNSTSDAQTVREATAYVHIMQGVIATRIEWALLRYNHPDLKGDVRNASEVFRVARKQGVSTATLRPGTAGQQSLARLSLPSDVKSEISASLTAGNTLVVPVKLVHLNGDSQIAWWQLNEKSGELIGIMPGGRGQAFSEYKFITRNVVFWGTIMKCEGFYPRIPRTSLNPCIEALCIVGAFGGLFFGVFADVAKGMAHLVLWSGAALANTFAWLLSGKC